MSDMKLQAASLREDAGRRRRAQHYQFQYKVYLGLLIFVVVAGLPIVGFPALRHRLSARAHAFYNALGPLSVKATPAWAKVGENRYPFPAEFEPPVAARVQYPGVFNVPTPVYRPPEGKVQDRSSVEPSESSEGARVPEAPAEGTQPEFRQGKIEKEAFDLLVNSNDQIASLVKGTTPSLRFKTWGAAKMEDDAFWVDLTFNQLPDNREIHYVWKVKLSSKEVTPLSHNARALAKS